MKRIISISLLLLLFCMGIATAEIELSHSERINTGSAVVILSVPSACKLTIQCDQHGYVLLDGIAYSGISSLFVPFGGTVSLTAIPVQGYATDVFTVSDATGVELTDNTITISKVAHDYVLDVSFAEIIASGITIDRDDTIMMPGMTLNFHAFTDPSGAIFAWSGSDDDVLTITEDGTVTAIGYGEAQVVADAGTASDSVSVTVRDMDTVQFPKALVMIDDEVMLGNLSIENAVIQSNVTAIGDRAFADCSNLRYIRIPSTVTSFGIDCFHNCPNLTILCAKDSVAHKYAKAQGILYQLIDS